VIDADLFKHEIIIPDNQNIATILERTKSA